jgi:hypothetical protein
MKAVAQKYTKLTPDTVIVIEPSKIDTVCVEAALEINESYPKEQRRQRNEALFLEMRKAIKNGSTNTN